MNPQPHDELAELNPAMLRARLLAWYDVHARDLPWRQRPGAKPNCDPYRVWVSEIMLQQTRVAAVVQHFHEFVRRFPTVEKLAAAREASVLAAWSGLGYYRRARMLHAAAKMIVRELGGKFPETAEGWRALPGIGRYTAAAIASIAFAEPVAVVDGNVERVLQRVSGRRLAGEELWRFAEKQLDRDRPGDFNQAMMELGATVCTPRVPLCLTCPLAESCARQGELPGTVSTARQKKREIHYALCYSKESPGAAVFLVQRPRNARLMAGMWELPEIMAETEDPFSQGAKSIAALKRCATQKQIPGSARNDNSHGSSRQLVFTLRHSITVTDYTVHVWRIPAPKGVSGEWVAVKRLDRIALTGLARKILRTAKAVAGNVRPISKGGKFRDSGCPLQSHTT